MTRGAFPPWLEDSSALLLLLLLPFLLPRGPRVLLPKILGGDSVENECSRFLLTRKDYRMEAKQITNKHLGLAVDHEPIDR